MRPWYILAIPLCCLLLTCGDGDNIMPTPTSLPYDYSPAFSNDGSRIAYSSYGRSNLPKPGLYITDTSGVNRSFIADWGMHPTWFPGDTEIVFFNHSYQIYLINLNTGLISLLVDMEFARFTAVTKDRRFLYFDASGDDTIWSMTIYRKNLISGDIDTLVGGQYPTLSPDEKWLAFNRNGIYIYNIERDSLVRLTNVGQGPCWSPTGDEIAFDYQPDGGSTGIYITNLKGNYHKITNGEFPHYSPDGTRIVYDAYSSDNETHIWLMNPDGGDKRQITF
jgi:Tol biopolymer transport system component